MNDVVELFDVEDLMGQAHEHLDNHEFEKALSLGKRIEEHRYSGGFEIQALALDGLGKNNKAIKVIKKGIKKAGGGPWVLWQLLGNHLSDQDKFTEALDAYSSGLALEIKDEESLRLNRAILFGRTDRQEEAKSELEAIAPKVRETGPETSIFWNHAAAYAHTLFDMQKYSELNSHVEAQERFIFDDGVGTDAKARLCALQASGFWLKGQVEDSNIWFRKATSFERNIWQLRWLARERLKKSYPPGGSYYEIIIEGDWPDTWHDESFRCSFFSTYRVVAASPEQGFLFAKEFEPAEIHASLRLEEFIEKETGVTDPVGVYSITGYNFYDRDADDDEE